MIWQLLVNEKQNQHIRPISAAKDFVEKIVFKRNFLRIFSLEILT